MNSRKEFRNLGAARQRRERRQRWSKIVKHLLLVTCFATLGAGLLAFMPAPLRQAQSVGTGPESLAGAVPRVDVPVSPISTLLPTQTHTPTPAPTTTPTSTPLPPKMMTATAWQDLVKQADLTSVALQTQYAANYSASQTALPATVSALATQLAATANVKTATAQAWRDGQQIKKP